MEFFVIILWRKMTAVLFSLLCFQIGNLFVEFGSIFCFPGVGLLQAGHEARLLPEPHLTDSFISVWFGSCLAYSSRNKF